MDRSSKIAYLKRWIEEYVKGGGSIQDKKDNLPYYNYLCNLIKSDRKEGKNSTIESIYGECGYEYISKRRTPSLERLKSEIDAYVGKGGSIYDRKEDLPYYTLMQQMIRKDKSLSIKELYRLCGYEYENKNIPATLERLKEEIDAYVNRGGSIYDKKEDLPYYYLMWQLIRKDRSLSVKELYRLCGYEYKDKRVPITLERLKREIDNYVDNGGDLSKFNKEVPFYFLMIDLIDNLQKDGYSYTVEDIITMCGYEFNGKKYSLHRLSKILDEVKDEDGYVDVLKESYDGVCIINRLRNKARSLNLNFNDYLMTRFGVRVRKAYSELDYISFIEESLLEYESKYGYENVNLKHISSNDKNLYGRIRHLAKYFPEGSITPDEVLDFYGYLSNDSKIIEINEKEILSILREMYPDKVVKGLSKNKHIYHKVVDLSVRNDQTVEQYLISKGFVFKTNREVYRLSKATVDRGEEYYRSICSLRRNLIESSFIMKNSNKAGLISEEMERIGNRVYETIILGKTKRVFKN